MNTSQLVDCSAATAVKLERVNFFNRQLLTADDMTTERDYFLQKLRRHNRFLHGWGVVCGLQVIPAPISGAPWRVQVGSGYALGPYGDEIFLGDPVYFDLAACLSGGMTNPCEPNLLLPGAAGTSSTVYLAIKYAECLARPVQVAYSGCGCSDDPCQYSRICDSFQLQCLPQLPEQPPPSRVTLCQINSGVPAPCPPCPTNPFVVLAKITLPSSSSTDIAASSIDNVSARRVILSSALLQEQIILCCCKQQPQPTPVALKDILVRQSPGPGAVATGFGPTAALGITPPQRFDFELDLTGAAPPEGFPITVTVSAVPDAPALTFSPIFPRTELITAGKSSLQVFSTSVNFSLGNYTQQLTITLTATDGYSTPKTATLTIPFLAPPK